MHGIILSELKRYVESAAGPAAWDEACREAGLAHRIYVPAACYPDEEATRLVASAARLTGQSSGALLEGFGEFIAPHLLGLYGHRILATWSCLDLIEHTEETIHEVLRSQDPHARPPRLRAERLGPDELVLRYASERRLCAVAKGIIRGVAKNYGEEVAVSEQTCMLQGDKECTLVVSRRRPQVAEAVPT